jgi:hypothetical protein
LIAITCTVLLGPTGALSVTTGVVVSGGGADGEAALNQGGVQSASPAVNLVPRRVTLELLAGALAPDRVPPLPVVRVPRAGQLRGRAERRGAHCAAAR